MVHTGRHLTSPTATDDGAIPPARRSLFAAAAFTTGLIIARAAPAAPSHWWMCAAAICALAALFARGRACRVLLAMAVLIGAGGWFTFRALERPSNDIARQLSHQPRLLTVEGMLIERPRVRTVRPGRLAPLVPSLEPSTSLNVEIDRLIHPDDGAAPASGRLLVFIGGDQSHLRAGDAVRLTGMTSAIRPATNPGEPPRELLACATGQSGIMQVEGAATLTIVARPANIRGMWRRFAAQARSRASTWLTPKAADDSGDSSRSLMRALFLGQRDESLRDVNDAFTRLGIAHILAISGLHLTMLAWALRQIVRTPGARPWLESSIVATIVAAYLLVAPAQAPVIRAAIMIIIFLIADASGRRYDKLTTLGWVYIITLIWQPMDLWNAGFQLSFGVVAALLTLARPTREKLFGPAPSPDSRSTLGALLHSAQDAIAASLCAWAVASPIVAFHMGIFSPLGAPVTVLLMPLVFALLSLGYIVMLASTILPEVAPLLTAPLTYIALAVVEMVRVLDTIPGAAVYLPKVSLPLTITLLATVIWWLAPLRFDIPRRLLRARLALSLTCCAWIAAELLLIGLPPRTDLRLDTIDVGDGACHLVRSGRDAMLYDCGSLRLAMGEFDLPRALRELGVWRVRSVIISHPNVDHYSALPDLAARLGVQTVFLGRATLDAAQRAPGGPVAVTLDALRSAGVTIREVGAGDAWTLGRARVEIISPPRDGRWKFDNDASLVTLVTVPGAGASPRHTLLFTGDIQRLGMAWTDQARPGLRVDVLEAPHHGSAHDAAYDFVADLQPAVVVQSSGARRMHDDRWREVRQSLDWRATPADGAITILMHSDGAREIFGWRARPIPPRPGGAGAPSLDAPRR